MDTNTPKCDDYEVGYKKPPKATQFKKGQSGNSRGRPPRAKDNAELFNKILDEKVSITDNGRLRQLANGHLSEREPVARLHAYILADMVQRVHVQCEPHGVNELFG